MQGTLVTVICITFNQEKYIRKALDGLLMQKTSFMYEILVHDDASTDCTPDIIKEYAERYPTIITPILQKENQYSRGVKITKDLLIPMARGKYIAVCEGDDYWTDPNKLQLQTDAMESHPECSMCVHKVQGISEDEKNRFRTFPIDDMETGKISAERIMHRMLAEGEWVFHTTSYFFRKADALEMNNKGCEFWNKPAYGDFSYMQMAALKGDFYYINRTMSTYRMGSLGSVVRRDKAVDHQKQRNIRFINAIKDFDEVSNYVFHNDAQIAIDRYRFFIADSERNYKVLFSSEMRMYWNELPLRARMRIRVSYFFPVFNTFYYKLRKRIKGY